jgi:hypothetical protein
MLKETKYVIQMIGPHIRRSAKVSRPYKYRRQYQYADCEDPDRRFVLGPMRGKDARSLYLHSVTFPHSY